MGLRHVPTRDCTAKGGMMRTLMRTFHFGSYSSHLRPYPGGHETRDGELESPTKPRPNKRVKRPKGSKQMRTRRGIAARQDDVAAPTAHGSGRSSRGALRDEAIDLLLTIIVRSCSHPKVQLWSGTPLSPGCRPFDSIPPLLHFVRPPLLPLAFRMQPWKAWPSQPNPLCHGHVSQRSMLALMWYRGISTWA